ncbi:hypothetical protein [Rhodococcoides yunnanense]|uniref:hypothetical protein n=1 Tax=Rhodococcoides yunnanense TaxID=278209 RepID=UPI000932B8B6|nr:hypothetical protein [Rhodococcus yunnanensis]
MTSEHSDVAAELWALAETVLTRLEPMLRRAVEEQATATQQGCSWCPVCALAALLRGEQHDLLTFAATEGATIVAMIRQLVAEHSGNPQTRESGEAATSTPHANPTAGDSGHSDDSTIAPDTDDPVVRRAGFVPITVDVKKQSPEDRDR